MKISSGKKTALVVGGSGGIGKEIVGALASQDVNVVSAAIDSIDSQVSENLWTRRLDVTNEQSIVELFAWMNERFQRLDWMVNASGVGTFKKLRDLSAEEWDNVIKINLRGAFLCTRETIRMMHSSGGGRIVNIGSISDHMALIANGAYAASKFGVRALTQIVNEEENTHGIRATLLSLGAVGTEIWNGRDGFNKDEMIKPAEVAKVICTIFNTSNDIRMDEMKLFPSKGVL